MARRWNDFHALLLFILQTKFDSGCDRDIKLSEKFVTNINIGIIQNHEMLMELKTMLNQGKT